LSYLIEQIEVDSRALIVSDEPTISTHNDVLITPFSKTIYYDSDPRWGVYDDDGRLIPEASLDRGWPPIRVGQSEQIEVQPDWRSLPTLDGEFYYGGPILNHFGHFICSSLARLWWLAGLPIGDRKVLFHGGSSLNAEMATDYVSQCFEALGLNPGNASVVETPTLVRRLHVPSPAFVEQSYGCRVLRETCLAIGERHWSGDDQHGHGPVYISKSAMTAGIRRLEQEHIIEEILSKAGISIVHPETMGFGEQIKLFSQQRTIIGLSGSAFHTSIFAPAQSSLLCLAPIPVSGNQIILDKLSGVQVQYLRPVEGTMDLGPQGEFHSVLRLKDPERIAEELRDIALG
jgi:hypothetical protein